MARRVLSNAARVGLVVVLAGGAAVRGFTGTWIARKHLDHHPRTPAPTAPAAHRAPAAAPTPAATPPAAPE
ncbi:MAG: hypothetical protein J0H43_05180, partial [Actinobacteria bacterium]|nr:hypothetical protein [Actinomycetota bacterium]